MSLEPTASNPFDFPVENCVVQTGEGWRNIFQSLAALYNKHYIQEEYAVQNVKEKFGELRLSVRTLHNESPNLDRISTMPPKLQTAWQHLKELESSLVKNLYSPVSQKIDTPEEAKSKKENYRTKVEDNLKAILRFYKASPEDFSLYLFSSLTHQVSDLSSHVCMTCGALGVIGSHKKNSSYISCACANCSETLKIKNKKNTGLTTPVPVLDVLSVEAMLFLQELRATPQYQELLQEVANPNFACSPENLLKSATPLEDMLKFMGKEDGELKNPMAYSSVLNGFKNYVFCYEFIRRRLDPQLPVSNGIQELHSTLITYALPTPTVSILGFLTGPDDKPVATPELFDIEAVLTPLRLKIDLDKSIELITVLETYDEAHIGPPPIFSPSSASFKEQNIKKLKQSLLAKKEKLYLENIVPTFQEPKGSKNKI